MKTPLLPVVRISQHTQPTKLHFRYRVGLVLSLHPQTLSAFRHYKIFLLKMIKNSVVARMTERGIFGGFRGKFGEEMRNNWWFGNNDKEFILGLEKKRKKKMFFFVSLHTHTHTHTHRNE